MAANEEDLLEAQIQQEIEQMKALVFTSAHRQLEAQNATRHMDAYIALFAPQIEHSIRAKYATLAGETYSPQELTRYAFTFGGAISYTSLNVQVLSTYYCKKDTTCVIIKKGKMTLEAQQNTLDDIDMILDVSDFYNNASANVAVWVALLRLFAEVCITYNSYLLNQVEDHGYASVSKFSDSIGISTVLSVWELYPFVYADATLEDFQYERFSSHTLNCSHNPSCFS